MTKQLEDLYDKTDMVILAAGGREALTCFIQLSRRVLEAAGDRGLRSFVREVLPLLPEEEKMDLVVLLFTTVVDDRQARKKAVLVSPYKLH